MRPQGCPVPDLKTKKKKEPNVHGQTAILFIIGEE